MRRKEFTKLKRLGNGLCLYLDKRARHHLKIYEDSNVCMTFNKNGTITISKASYSDRLIEDIIKQLGQANPQ